VIRFGGDVTMCALEGKVADMLQSMQAEMQKSIMLMIYFDVAQLTDDETV
jgi:hypothetical protein